MKLRLIVFILITALATQVSNALGTEIALEQYRIPEGNFSILLYKPQRTELPLRDKQRGITITEYTYQSYFSAFDASYVAGFTDWTTSKAYEVKKYGSPLSGVEEDLRTSIQGIQVTTQQRLRLPVQLILSKEIRYGSHLGREAEFTFTSAGLKYIIKYRTYLVGHMEYWHRVVYPAQYERYVRPMVFLDSFRIMGK